MLVLLWQGCFIFCRGICSDSFSETLHHQDKLYEFQLAFVEHGSYQISGKFQIAWFIYARTNKLRLGI